jgi:fimbrial chaperone protein
MRVSIRPACFAVLLACYPLIAAQAGGFQVSPTIARIASGEKVATFELGNRGSEPVTVQSDVLSWTQEGGQDRTVPALQVLVAPRVVTIPPGGSQLVRIAVRTIDANAEQAYRVRFREVPAPVPEGFVGLRTLITHDVPVFFLAAGTPDVAWRAVLDENGVLIVSAANRGTRHLRLSALEVESQQRPVIRSQGPRYVLARSAVAWPVARSTDLQRGDRIQLRAVHDRGAQDVPLVIE